jgi:flagellar protein FliS
LSADPVELIGILYEYAVTSVQDARNGLAQGNIADRSKAIAKVIAILGELESSLDHKLGGEIALNLGRLYRYMRERLTSANLRQVDEPLAEVEALLKTLGEAWQAIGAPKVSPHDDGGEPMTHGDWAPPMTDPMPDFVSHSWSA